MPLPAGNFSSSIPRFFCQKIFRPLKRLTNQLAFIFFLSLFALSPSGVNAQDNFGSEKELKSQAEKFFKDDDFASALPLYSQLLSLYPGDPNYNYKFGVCLLYATENKEKPLSYLIFGVGKEGVEEEAYYHLGRAFHLNYRFDEAIVQYSLYKNKAGSKAAAKLDVDRQIAMCNNGKNLLRNVTDLVVMERKELNASEYFRAYDLGGLDAKLVVKPDDLASSVDKKKKEKSTVVVRQSSQEIYYSSYGADGKSGRDIYKITRLPNFQWSKEENLGSIINTPYDEDFPYVTPDGKTLFFSSKGHNSMGGYDVFKSEWDEQSKTWSKPVNLDFAINTPDDDIQYVTDPKSDYGFFSSKRSVPEGKITVYKIKTERIPPTISAIRGQFNCDFKPPQFKARISIKNLENGKFVGTIGTNEKTGVYRVNLNNGNKYEYTVESPGYAPITQVVEIPTMTEQRPLRQEIQLKKVNGEDLVQIVTFFADTAQDEASALARADWLKDKAMLDVNADQVLTEGSGTPVAQKKDLGPNRNAYVGADFSKLKLDNEQLLKIAKEDVADAQKDLNELESKTEKAYALADSKNDQAEVKQNEAEKYAAEAEKIAAGPLKEEKQNAAGTAAKESQQLANEARVAIGIARQLEAETAEAREELAQSKKYEEDLAKAIQSDSKEAIKTLSEQGAKIQEENSVAEKEKSGSGNEISNRELLIGKMKTANQKSETEIDELEQDKVNIADSMKSVSDDAQKASMQQELTEIDAQIKSKKRSIAQNNEKIVTYQNEIDQVIADERMAKQLNEQIESSPEVKLTQAEKVKIAEKTAAIVSAQPAVAANPNATASVQKPAETKQEVAKETVEPKENKQENVNLVSEEKKETGETGKESLAQNNEQKNNESALQNPVNEAASKTDTALNPAQPEESLSEKGTEQSPIAEQGGNPAVAKLQEAQRVEARLDSLSSAISSETDENKLAAMLSESRNLKEKELTLKIEGKTTAMELAKEQGSAQVKTFREKLEINNRVSENRAELVGKDIDELQSRIARADDYFEQAKASSDAEKKDSLLTLSMNIMSSAESKMNEIHVGNVDLFDAPPSLLPKIEMRETKPAVAANEVSKPAAQARIVKPNEEVRNNAIVKQYEPSLNYESNLQLSKQELEEVKATSAYIQFESLLNKSQEYIAEGRKQAVISEEIRSRGQNKLMESQSLVEMAAEENNKKKQQMLAENAIDVDREGKDLIQDADSVKNIAVKEMRKAGAIKNEAEKVLNKLSKFERDQIISAYVQPEISEEEQKVVALNNAAKPLETKGTQQELVQPAQEKNESSVAEKTKSEEPVAVNGSQKQESTSVQNPVKSEQNSATASEKVQPSQETGTVEKTEEKKSEPSLVNTPASKTEKAEEKAVVKTEPKKNPTSTTGVEDKPAAKSAAQLIAEEKKTPEFMAYSDLKDRVTEQEQKSMVFAQQADSVSKQAIIAENNSSDLLEFAAALRDKKKRKEAQEKAMAFDEEARLLKDEAAKLRANSGSAKLESMRLQSSADSVLVVTGEERASRIRMAYNNVVPKEETVLASNVVNSEKESDNQTKQPTKIVEPAAVAETTKAENAKQEQPNKTSEAVVKTKNEKQEQPNKTAEPVVKTETAKQEPTAKEEKEIAKTEQKETAKVSTEEKEEKNATARIETTPEKTKESEQKTTAGNEGTSTAKVEQKSEKSGLAPVHKTADYIAYRGLMNQVDSLKKAAEVYAKKSETTRAESDRMYDESNTLLEQAANAKKKDRKAIIEQATESENTAVRLREEADSLSNRSNELKAMARTKESAAQLNLSKLNQDYALRIVKTYNGLEDTTIVASATNETGEQSKEPEKITESVTQNEVAKTPKTENRKLEEPRVSEAIGSNNFRESFSLKGGVSAGEIPMNPALPPGIVYKVQIGAFKRPLPGNAFGNVSPVAGETTNSGWIRYTAGLFPAFNKAQNAKSELNGRGFGDAFVVAYCNGQRISVSKAREMERAGTSCDGTAVVARVENKSGIENQTVEPNTNTTKVSSPVVEKQSIAPGEILPQTGLSEVKGLVYTIQIGVYRKMVTAGQLYNIQPLYYELLDNGLYRYTTGVYNNLRDAGEAKNIAVGFGISDAFITAYRGGKRISMDQAAALVAQNGQGVFDQGEGMNRMPTQLTTGAARVEAKKETVIVQSPEPKIDVTKKGNTNAGNTSADLSQLLFKVQLGAFRNEVPVDVLNKYLSMAGKGITNIKTEDGLTIYMVGSFKTREEAQQLREVVLTDGIPDAFVVAVYQGKKISLEEAAQLIQNR